MAGSDELSARLPAAERVSLPVRLKQRAIIAFLTAEKIPPIQIHARLKTVYGDAFISVCTDVSSVRLWAKRASEAGDAPGHVEFGGATRSERPLTARPNSSTGELIS